MIYDKWICSFTYLCISFPQIAEEVHATSNALVDSKVLSSVGKKLRGYKWLLRMKYIKKDTTSEQLYALPSPEPAKRKWDYFS